MEHPDVSNIDVDWLYRGKKKSRRSMSSSKEKKEKPVLEKQPLSKDVIKEEHPKLEQQQQPLKVKTEEQQDAKTRQQLSSPPTISPASSSSSFHTVQPPTPEPTGRSLLSKALRPRANSDSRAKTIQRGITPPPSPAAKPSSASLQRSNSLTDKKPKKTNSLFSVFSKRNKTAPNSPEVSPINIPNGHQHHHHLHSQPSPIISSSLESLSPKADFLGKILFPIPEAERVVLNKNPNRQTVPIKELTEVKLRRVTFALDKLQDDPPQQIPSRRPKKGNVTVVDDLIGEPLKLSIGITNEAKLEPKAYDEKELRAARDQQRLMLEEAEKHAQEAHKAAQRIAHEVLTFKNKKSSKDKEDEEDEKLVEAVKEVEIDTAIHLHEQLITPKDEQHEREKEEISLEQIYTRCCHLREILPIPATLKQLKNKTSPLQTLKLLNPKPTLIDVYSFSDFIAIVPIKNLIFDNVTMSTEMFKIFLSSLVCSTTIEKLSLRNVPIDEQGWKVLCKFLSRNKSISKLDISQQKIKSDLPSSQHRSEMDWNLFIDTLALRGGIEEILINGCKLPLPTFGRLIDEGVSKATKRLGVAQCDLSLDHIKILTNWIAINRSTCEGLDLGYNDLSQGEKLKPLIKKSHLANQLQAISLNSTNLVNVEDVALIIRSLSKLPNMRFIDLSNLSPIFPGILPYLNKYLPRFPNLNRLHLDHNELSTKSLTIISEIIPKCEKLVHVSITGNSTVSYAGAAALYSAVKSSKTLLNFDLDYDLIDEKISSRVAVCLMRNMERTYHDAEHSETHDDILFDGSLIAETATKLLDKINASSDLEHGEDFTKKFLKKQFLEKVKRSRENVNKTMDELMYKRDHDQLTLQEKEDLLRFYFLDTSLAKVVEIFDNLPDNASTVPPPQTASTLTPAADIIPHQMALEVNEGKATPVDVSTGRPIFLRSVSQQSIQAKKQEEEEGEFHRWGFFVQQQRQLLPNDAVPAKNAKDTFFVPKLPSGTELRDAVIKAKGIDSISTLIDNVNQDKFDMAKIYPSIHEHEHEHEHEPKELASATDGESLNSLDDIQEVDEAYDKLLNDLSRVRSNK
jgi:hypothetical protein